MQRAGLIHFSSMTAVCAAPRADNDAVLAASLQTPWKTHMLHTCSHAEAKPRLKFYERGGRRAMMQCLKCGQKVGNFIPVAAVSEKWDEDLEQSVRDDFRRVSESWALSKREAWNEAKEEASARWWHEYDKYRRTSVWAVKRELVMKRCEGVCEACGQRRADHVHHVKYPDVFGLEPLWDLRAVCVPCHKLIHPHME